VLPEWLVADSGKSLRRLLDGWTTPVIRAWALHRTEVRDSPRIRAVVAALSSR
jgi:DNA-binding transcriptional LysR family regulator